MALPLAIPLAAPIAPGAVAAAATFAVGTVAHVAQQVYGFRAPLPPLPRATGRVGEETLQELIADAIAGARIPVALPPSPFGPSGNLAALAVGGLLQLWGQLNSRPEASADVLPIPGISASGTVPPPGNQTPGTLTINRSAGTYTQLKDCVGPTVTGTFPAAVLNYTNVIGVSTETSSAAGCGTREIQARLKRLNQADLVVTVHGTNSPGGVGMNLWNAQISYTWSGAGAVPFGWPQSALDLPSGFSVPELAPEPAPAVAPVPLPLPLPSTVPQPTPQPEAEPEPSVVPVTPGPKAPPTVRPATPISPQQPKAPAPIATNNGVVVAPAPLPVPTTPEDAVFPVPGGLPVTGQTVAPTIQAVAQEVGRIEQKIDRMVNPNPGQWGDATDWTQLIWQLLSQLYNATTDGAPSGSYELTSPCEVDEDGNRLVYEVNWPEQGTNHGAILARVNAIADLLQLHKDLKQPNCHLPPVAVGGEFVTVNFEQID